MSFHERAVKADKETRKTMEERLLKKYPNIDLSRFKILTHVDNNANAHPEVQFMDSYRSPAYEVDYDIEGDDKARFWDNHAAVHTVPLL